jgi:hypothetical protein
MKTTAVFLVLITLASDAIAKCADTPDECRGEAAPGAVESCDAYQADPTLGAKEECCCWFRRALVPFGKCQSGDNQDKLYGPVSACENSATPSPSPAKDTGTGNGASGDSKGSNAGDGKAGCFGISTACQGNKIGEIIGKSGRRRVTHLGRELIGKVLCTDGSLVNTGDRKSGDILCLTPEHLVLNPYSNKWTTMQALCESIGCTERNEKLINYWHRDMTNTISCDGITTGQRSGALGAATLKNERVYSVLWPLTRLLHI